MGVKFYGKFHENKCFFILLKPSQLPFYTINGDNAKVGGVLLVRPPEIALALVEDHGVEDAYFEHINLSSRKKV